jgi:hypothetical protein
MTQKQVCQLDAESYFVGLTTADESPLEAGVYLIPGGCIDTAAPTIPDGQRAKWVGEWVFEDIQKPEPEPPTPEEIQANIVESTQKRLDDFARTRNYDGILSLCTYATSTKPKFAAEGQYGVEARDDTWAKLYEIMAEVQAGTRPMPESYEDIEDELPVLEWPA